MTIHRTTIYSASANNNVHIDDSVRFMISYNSLAVALLRAELINKNFIHGEDNCNYELYLLELLNNSSWFKLNYPGDFVAPESEAHGECDANNDLYQIDFKLFAANSALRARKLLSNPITKVEPGLISYGTSKSPDKKLLVTRLFAAFRRKSVDELISIRNMPAKRYSVNYDIKESLKSLEVLKNILLFLPYSFSFKDEKNDKEGKSYQDGIEIIRSALNSDFKGAFDYRNKITDNLDTFITCIYNDNFLLFQVIDDVLVLRDIIDSKLLPTYQLLSDYNEL